MYENLYIHKYVFPKFAFMSFKKYIEIDIFTSFAYFFLIYHTGQTASKKKKKKLIQIHNIIKNNYRKKLWCP